MKPIDVVMLVGYLVLMGVVTEYRESIIKFVEGLQIWVQVGAILIIGALGYFLYWIKWIENMAMTASNNIPKQNRNELCLCGSGLKHKVCCTQDNLQHNWNAKSVRVILLFARRHSPAWSVCFCLLNKSYLRKLQSRERKGTTREGI